MLLSNNKTHLAFKQHHLKEKFWTHKELFKYFNMSVEGSEVKVDNLWEEYKCIRTLQTQLII